MTELLEPSTADLIREIGLVLIGLFIRFIERKKDKKKAEEKL